MKPLVTMREALADPRLLGGAIPGPSWLPQRTLLIAAMGEALTDDERPLFTEVTGREREPLERVDELWGIIGRRAGKTRMAGTLAAYVGVLCDHSDLAPGERGVLPILAATKDQAAKAFMHAEGILRHSPVLSEAIAGEPTAETIRLNTFVDIEVRPANFRTIRGITAVAAICDEVAFWSIENSSNPDEEILGALRPALATTGGPLIVISSPHGRRGVVYTAFRKHYGPAGNPLILVAKGASRTFNSALKQSVVDKAYEEDAARASAEYGGEFRNDIEAFIQREVVEACVIRGVYERPRQANVRYFGFVDPSGGSNDAMTLAIAHREGDSAALDAMRERKPPFSPEAVVTEFSDLLKAYGIASVVGDRYAGEWPREAFRKAGIRYDLAEKTRSDLYRDLLPKLNSGQAELLDSERLVTQFVSLERRVARGGRESIDHPPNGHDDLANAVAGAIDLAAGRTRQPMNISAEAVAEISRAPAGGAFALRRSLVRGFR